MTDSLENLLANVDDLDDLLRDSDLEEKAKEEPENVEVSLDSKELDETLKESPGTSAPGAETGEEAVPDAVPPAPKPVEKAPPAEAGETPPVRKSDELYSIPGTKEWNTSPPYFIKIEAAALEKEEDQLENIFFFVDIPVSQEDGSDVVKKALINYMRKPDRDLEDNYRVFLYQELLKELLEINTLFLEKGGSEKELYYHIGAATVFRILMAKFKHEKRGYCFCYTGSGKGVRLFPEEIIKTVVMDWYTENIFASSLDFDNISIYDRVKRKVNEQYREDRRRFQILLEKVNLRAGEGRSITASRFLALKGNDIIGPAKLQIYKRFIGNNLFI